MLSKHVTFNETLLLKSTISQQVERLKTKDRSQREKVDATPPFSVDLVSVGISPDVRTGGDYVTVIDTEQVELVAAKEIKLNLRKWVKKRESEIGELDKLKLKVIVLYDGIGKEIHMTQLVGFITTGSVSVD